MSNEISGAKICDLEEICNARGMPTETKEILSAAAERQWRVFKG